MSPRGWDGDFYTPKPRRAVEGGVVVAKPGKVTGDAAAELVAAAEMETLPQILARGRTYARAGQVVALEATAGAFAAQIQGSDRAPYRVQLLRTIISGSDRIAAHCSCPYGCDRGWCKHAAALAYVAAFLLDTQPGAAAAWRGEDDDGPPAGGGTPTGPGGTPAAARVATLSEEDLAILRRPVRPLDVVAILTAAESTVPHPWVPADAGGPAAQSRT